jgi:amino acid adenylation domain-containing protein
MQLNILEYLWKTVSVSPSKSAIVDKDRSITFGELNNKAKILGLTLCRYRITNKPVAVFLPKSIECIISDIAVTYSGNLYMNLDVKAPELRIGSIISQIKPSVIITNRSNLHKINRLNFDIPIVIIDDIDYDSIDNSLVLNKIFARIIDTDPWCIINTSGSTGIPKGVVLNHRSYIDFTDWAISTFNFTGNEVLGVLSPVFFDHFNYEICLMMAKGCTLVLLDNNLASFPVTLIDEVKRQKVSYIFWVPTIMVNIANLDLLSRIPLPDVRMVWFAGEVFPTKQFNYWRKHLPSAKFVNLYGPVETTVDCTYYIIKRELSDEEPIPIGRHCRNKDVLIFNEKNELAAIGEEGELCVRGSSLAMGYYNNPEKTNEAFIQNPLNSSYPEIIYRTGDIVYRNKNNEIIFVGRKDNQIKHLGYRIELGEVEHALINNLKIVDNGCVVYDHKKKEIVLFYESTENISIQEIRKKLIEVLPKYMVPTKYFRQRELPRNANGKIDRQQLKTIILNEAN